MSDNQNQELTLLKKEIDRLKKAIKKQKYGLVWMDVPEAFEDDVENKLPILKEVPELAIKNDDSKPTHILIEGDNYHALTCLNYTHKGKIDLIYIDPPYNTGSDGFRYKDKRIIDKFPDGTEVPKDHPFRHSYWLSFMKKRLQLCWDILSSDGILYISIDDNEMAQLKLLCDELFTENCFVTTIVVQMSTVQGEKVRSAKKGNIVKNKEYILAYSKNGKQNLLINPLYDPTPYDSHYNLYLIKKTKDIYREVPLSDFIKDQVVLWKILKINGYVSKRGKSEYLPNRSIAFAYDSIEMFRRFINENASSIFRSHDVVTINKRIINKAVFKGNIVKYESKQRSYYVGYDGKRFLQRIPLSDKIRKANDFYETFGTANIRGDWWPDFYLDMGNISKEGGVKFENGKKPIRLIKQLIYASASKDSIILDYFAGSGTTGHATIALNNEDGGNRQFIICTNNEDEICNKTCYPRMNNIMKGKNGVDKLGNSLKYYKTAFIGRNNILNITDVDKVELAHNAGELLAIAENTLYLAKKNKYFQIFEDGNKTKYTAIYFREELDKYDDFSDVVEKLKKTTTVYIFSWGNDEFVDSFSHIKGVTVKTIPQPIIEIYKCIYNLGAQ